MEFSKFIWPLVVVILGSIYIPIVLAMIKQRNREPIKSCVDEHERQWSSINYNGRRTSEIEIELTKLQGNIKHIKEKVDQISTVIIKNGRKKT